MNTRKLTRTALFAALTAAGAFIRIPLGYSSITLQFLCTAMAGCLLGPAYGAASQAVYVALGLIGLPIFTQGGGLSYLMQPTCGFLIGLIPTAWLIGLLTAKRELPAPADGGGVSGGPRHAVCRGPALHGGDPQRVHGQGHGCLRHPMGRYAAVPARGHAEDRRHRAAGPLLQKRLSAAS